MLARLLAPRRHLLQQAREIRRLRREVAALKQQNISMREGMRRCLSCEYRLDFKSRQGEPPGDPTATSP